MNLAKLRALLHQAYQALGRTFGFRVYSPDLGWSDDPEYRAVWARFPGPKSRYVHERRFNLFNLAKATATLHGDSAECGALHGEGSFLIMAARTPSTAIHHIFDSFAGLSAPDPTRDVPQNTMSRPWQHGDLSVPMQLVARNLREFSGRFQLHPGWIPERFEAVAYQSFSFVHLDVDLYQPTLDSLRFFYQRLIPGGILICDDYGFRTCPGARRAMDEFFAALPENIVELTTGQAFVVKLAAANS